MRIHARRLWLLPAALLSLTGAACRTRLLVSEVNQPTCETFVDGIPFRVRETHTIRVYQWHKPLVKTTYNPDGSVKARCVATPGHFQRVLQRQVAFPNMHRLFALNLHSENLADSTLDLTYFPDNTLRKVESKGTPKGEGFAALGGAINTAGTKILSAERDIETKVKEAQTARDTENASALDNLLTYYGAVSELQSHCTRFEFDASSPTGITPEEREKREQTARTLLKDAMSKAAKAKQKFFQGNPFALGIEDICTLVRAAQ